MGGSGGLLRSREWSCGSWLQTMNCDGPYLLVDFKLHQPSQTTTRDLTSHFGSPSSSGGYFRASLPWTGVDPPWGTVDSRQIERGPFYKPNCLSGLPWDKGAMLPTSGIHHCKVYPMFGRGVRDAFQTCVIISKLTLSPFSNPFFLLFAIESNFGATR